MTQLRYLATALVLLVGCAAEPLTETDSDVSLDPVASEPDLAGATDDTAPPATGQDSIVTEDGLPPDSAESEPRPGRGEPCPEDKCALGQNLECLKYYGFAGPAGGLLTSCETPCGPADQCPEGLSCITIADGPGQVCRPVEGE